MPVDSFITRFEIPNQVNLALYSENTLSFDLLLSEPLLTSSAEMQTVAKDTTSPSLTPNYLIKAIFAFSVT